MLVLELRLPYQMMSISLNPNHRKEQMPAPRDIKGFLNIGKRLEGAKGRLVCIIVETHNYNAKIYVS